uniref:Brix domain-containing protein n=1 Tax=Taeniopygia guttata TaxID=59729 RepID=H1A0E6_TAEGU
SSIPWSGTWSPRCAGTACTSRFNPVFSRFSHFFQYSLVRDVVSSLRRHRMHEQQFRHPPLLVLGNFGARQPQLKLMAGMFQGMFPALNVHKVNLNSIRRCLLISHDADAQRLEFRHYSVQVVPVGLSRGIRKILQEKFPNLARMDDISQLLLGDAPLSESEAEPDGPQNVLELAQNCAGRGNSAAQQSAVRLTEIGPRLTLQLLKVEEGLGQGNVLYHGLAPKGEQELQVLQARREQRLQVRAERRREQEQNLQAGGQVGQVCTGEGGGTGGTGVHRWGQVGQGLRWDRDSGVPGPQVCQDRCVRSSGVPGTQVCQGQVCQELRYARSSGVPGQVCQGLRCAQVCQGQVCQGLRCARTDVPGQVCQGRCARDRCARDSGVPGQMCQDRCARAGVPGQVRVAGASQMKS